MTGHCGNVVVSAAEGHLRPEKLIMPELSAHACFECRKVFKKPHWYRTKQTPVLPQYPCPECGKILMSMGYKFRAPRQDDVKSWKRIQHAIETGTTWEDRTIRKEETRAQPRLGVHGRYRAEIEGTH